MGQKKVNLAETFRKLLLQVDIVFHVVAALLLLTACGFILYYAALNLLEPSLEAVIHLINDVLLALIILELLWTVIRFLKKQRFILAPFLAIGIIAAIRRLLMIEAQTSFMEHVPVEKLYEIGLSAAVVVVLMVAYYLAEKSEAMNKEK